MATPSRLVRTTADTAAAAAPRARVFIGSSTKSRPIAERMAGLLEGAFDVTPWWSAFPPGDLTLETLLEARARYDCALLVFAKDDVIDAPAGQLGVARDNVVMEFGLFLAALGKARVLVLAERGVKELSDLAGWTYLKYSDPSDLDTLDLQLQRATERVRERWLPLPPREETPRPPIEDHALGFANTLDDIADRLARATRRLAGYRSGVAAQVRERDPFRFDLSRACISTYADAMDGVRRRFWTTTYLTSGFWNNSDQDVVSANTRLVERCGQGGDLRRLFLVPRPPESEMEAQREKRLWLRRTGDDAERRRLDDGLEQLARNIKAQMERGFQVRVASDERSAHLQLPRDLDFEPNDTEIAVYDDFRFDVFSGGRSGRIHAVHCYTDLTADFQGFLEPAVAYFEELWAGARPADVFIEDLLRVRREVEAQIDYEPHWLAQYEFALSADDENLKTVEMHRVFEILRKHKKAGEIGDCLDIGTCTGRYPIRLRGIAAAASRVIGVDADPDCVRFAAAIVRKEALQNHIAIRKVDFLHESWPIEGQFDVVTCMLGTLSHFGLDRKATREDGLQRALARMATVLAPDGLLFLSNWSEEACTTTKMLEIYRPGERARLARWTVPPDELKARLRNVGLRVLDEAQPDVRLDLFTCVHQEIAP